MLISDEGLGKDKSKLNYLFGIRSAWEFHLLATYLAERAKIPTNHNTVFQSSTLHELIIQIEDWPISASRCFSGINIDGNEIRSGAAA